MNSKAIYFIHDGELLCTERGETTVFVSRDLHFTPRQLRAWRERQNLRVRAVATGKHQPGCNISRYRHVRDGEPESGLRYCTCRTFPRPRRAARALREVVELTPAAARTAAASAARALHAANEEYIDLAGLQQEGSRISPAAYDAVAKRYQRATRLQETCDTLLNIAA